MIAFVLPLIATSRSAIGWVKHTHEVIAAVDNILFAPTTSKPDSVASC